MYSSYISTPLYLFQEFSKTNSSHYISKRHYAFILQHAVNGLSKSGWVTEVSFTEVHCHILQLSESSATFNSKQSPIFLKNKSLLKTHTPLHNTCRVLPWGAGVDGDGRWVLKGQSWQAKHGTWVTVLKIPMSRLLLFSPNVKYSATKSMCKQTFSPAALGGGSWLSMG